MKVVDLRSDTVTFPTPAMRAAMAEAEVGDDVYGEDPTVNRLQRMAAEKLGKEAGLFVASGTMGNLVAILAHCQRGDEVILGNRSHTFLFEAGGISALGGVHSCQLSNQADGTLDLAEIRSAIRGADDHEPISRLISLENTHNRCGGIALGLEYTRSVAELAHQQGLKLHLDAARVFNAAIALGIDARNLVEPVDSLTFCLSKGLCAPVGSILCGSEAFIHQARRIRKQLGGGMRQAGILAAAGIVALQEMIERLEEDHRRAAVLANELSEIPGLVLDLGMPQTNMVFLSLAEDYTPLSAAEIAQGLKQSKILIGVVGERSFRLVTHYWINDEAVEQTLVAFRKIL